MYLQAEYLHGKTSILNVFSILLKILGTPSMEQLLWEKAQRSPLERSSITRKYLQDRRNGSEEVTASYLRLSMELNMIRHLHARIHFEKVNE